MMNETLGGIDNTHCMTLMINNQGQPAIMIQFWNIPYCNLTSDFNLEKVFELQHQSRKYCDQVQGELLEILKKHSRENCL